MSHERCSASQPPAATGTNRRWRRLRAAGWHVSVHRTIPLHEQDRGPSAMFISVSLGLGLAAAMVVLTSQPGTFGAMLAAAGVALMVISIARAILAFRGLRGSVLTFCSVLLTAPLLIATVIATYAPTAVLSDNTASVWSLDPQAHPDIPPSIIGAGDITVSDDTARHYVSALAAWSFTVADQANYRFVITGIGEVTITDIGGWKLVHDGEHTITDATSWHRSCHRHESTKADLESDDAARSEECFDYRSVNHHEFRLTSGQAVEVLTPAAQADPAHTREIVIDVGFGLLAINSAGTPDQPAHPQRSVTSLPATPNGKEARSCG